MTVNNKNVSQKTERKLTISERDRWQMIAATAYHKADERGFDNFCPDQDPVKDWDEAEKEVDQFLIEDQ